MANNMFKKGFKAVKEEGARREKAREQRQGKLWRLFFPKDCDEEYEIPFRFFTDEPICFYEHRGFVQGKVTNTTCTGEGCKDCADGDKPQFVGAFLGIDRSEFEVDERDSKGNKTGKKTTVTDRAKLLVRGQTDLAVLHRLKTKQGLLDRDWAIFKTGADTTTKWNFERGELDEWTEKEMRALLPEKYRDMDLYDIIIDQISPADEEEVEKEEVEEDAPKRGTRSSGRSNSGKSTKGSVSKGVQRIEESDDEDDEDDEDEDDEYDPEEVPKKKSLKKAVVKKKLRR